MPPRLPRSSQSVTWRGRSTATAINGGCGGGGARLAVRIGRRRRRAHVRTVSTLGTVRDSVVKRHVLCGHTPRAGYSVLVRLDAGGRRGRERGGLWRDGRRRGGLWRGGGVREGFSDQEGDGARLLHARAGG
eukprot:1212475-Pleurochrysis_carterae.AAC.1